MLYRCMCEGETCVGLHDDSESEGVGHSTRDGEQLCRCECRCIVVVVCVVSVSVWVCVCVGHEYTKCTFTCIITMCSIIAHHHR